ncbi:hypothetical protein HII31_03615 [Pseudocercospora fuligena]|uniref:Uncharacterized protein n=1 Tax=Pseudocercospora fuligena TaxID=685502 RepID=A0A8H6VLY0_9PEZI|nr:hypothetical protein HII31_03615 [Pseudocercospora fuligena]
MCSILPIWRPSSRSQLHVRLLNDKQQGSIHHPEINRKDCQDWILEYLARLVSKGFIDQSALNIARTHRDPSNLGVFGQNTTGPAAAPQGQTTQAEHIWDDNAQRYKYYDGRTWKWS